MTSTSDGTVVTRKRSASSACSSTSIWLHLEARALLARDVRDEALHPPGGPGARDVKEHQQRPGIDLHGRLFPLQKSRLNARRERRVYTPPGCGRSTGSASRSASASRSGCCSAGCSRRGGRSSSWSPAVAGAAGFGVGWAIGGWHEAIAGAAGGVLATLIAGAVVTRTIEAAGREAGRPCSSSPPRSSSRRSRWIPVLGYLEVAAVPALAARARRRRPERYAGLRTLARDECPPGNTCPLLARDHAAPGTTLALAKATSLGRGRVRPLAWCSRPRS